MNRPSVPLSDAIITWDDNGRVHVYAQGSPDCCNLPYSDGAAWGHWRTGTTTERLLKLYVCIHRVCSMYGIPRGVMHEALSVIPEYEETLPSDFEIIQPRYATRRLNTSEVCSISSNSSASFG